LKTEGSKSYESHDQLTDKIKIDKSRKSLQIIQNEDETKIKFDYISSLLDNSLEEERVCKETELINKELNLIFLSYSTKMNSFNDERNFFVFYLSKNIFEYDTDSSENFKASFCKNFLKSIHEVLKQMTQFNEFSLSVKLGFLDETHFLVKEKVFNDLNVFSFFLDEINENLTNIIKSLLKGDSRRNNLFKDISKSVMYSSFLIKNLRNKSIIKILNFSYLKGDIIGMILTKLSEINIAKKRKEKSSKKTQQKHKDIYDFLDEIEFNSNFFYSTILDFHIDDYYKSEDIKEILIHL
jgi:hypothetical protein